MFLVPPKEQHATSMNIMGYNIIVNIKTTTTKGQTDPPPPVTAASRNTIHLWYIYITFVSVK
jgi:hypothetical protein